LQPPAPDVFFQGKRNNSLGRDRVLENAPSIVTATNLPVSADLENGFGDTAKDVAQTIQRSIVVGLMGGSIEDADTNSEDPIYPIERAKERIEAACDAIGKSGIPFVLTAHAENYLHDVPNIGNTIMRLRAYQEAGADVLYAPGITSSNDISSIVTSLDSPVNMVMGLAGANYTQNDLSNMGVKRISVGSALARAALSAFVNARREMQE
jgi:2-methylisocitrate lyase-like PEP mutase family enzyme